VKSDLLAAIGGCHCTVKNHSIEGNVVPCIAPSRARNSAILLEAV
jgi:hypothetical protein